MPALGNKGAVSPAVIKQAAKRSAPPIRKVPATPTRQPVKNYVEVPHPTPAPKQFTGLTPPTRTFQRAVQNAAKRSAPPAQVRKGEAYEREYATKKAQIELAHEYEQTGKINPNLFKYENARPNLAEARPAPPPKPNFLERVVGAVGQGEKALEHGAGKAIGALEGVPGVTGVTPLHGGAGLSHTERQERNQRYGAAGVQALETAGTFGAAGVLRGAAAGLERAAALKGSEDVGSALADRGALRAAGSQAVKGVTENVPQDVLQRAPTTAAKLKELQGAVEATGGAPTVGSRALKLGAATSAGYGKLLAGSTVAKGAVASAEPKKHESFPEKFWHDTIHTIANLPAGAVQGITNPVKTAEQMAHLYTHPGQAFKENSFGTLLAFLAPAAAVERGAGGAIRVASKDRFLSQERPDLQYAGGVTQARQYQPGVVSQLAQRAAGLPAKRAGRVDIPGLQKVNGEQFAKAVDQARKSSPVHAKNLTEHSASEYTHAYLTKDGKAGYAVIKHGNKLADGRHEVEMVNLFRHGDSNKGIANSLIQHAITHHGANTLDAFEGKLTRKYANHGFITKDGGRVPNHTPGEPDVLYMRRPNVEQATKFQERRDILGSRLGGVVRPGQVDMIRGGERLARNLEVMKAHHFLDQHLPHDETHATAMIAFLEGVARKPETFWHDVADRVAVLKNEQHRLTGTDLAYNKDQVKRLTEMEQNRSKISDADLQHHERAAAQVAVETRHLWERLNREGIGHPDQLNARDYPALLSHGHLMGRGEITHVAERGPSSLQTEYTKAVSERNAAKKDVERTKSELKGARPKKGVYTGYHMRVEQAVERFQRANEAAGALGNKLQVAKHSGAVKPNGDLWGGLVDGQGKRITPAEKEQFIQEHFGREMGFITQKQDLARARSQNSYGPRTVYPMRTGGNFQAGAYDNSPAALRNHFERAGRNLATMGGRRSVAENLARMKEDGKPFTEAQAHAAADNMNRTPEGELVKNHLDEWVPYNLGAEKTTQLLTGHPYTRELEQQGLIEHKAIQEEAQGAATWGLLPKAIADRLNKWDQVESQVQGSMLRKMTTPWRQTNLYTSVRWPIGTTQENAIRLAAHQVSPLVVLPFGKHTSISFGTGSHIVRMLDEKINDPSVPAAQKREAIFHRSQFGTGNFAGSQLHELDPALHELADDSRWRAISESAPNTKVWRPYRRFVGNSLNKMETNAKIAAGGKLARGDISFFNKFRKMSSEQAAHDYVEKITTDPAQSIKAAGDLMEIMGNWNHLTPMTRQAQAEWAPFALWWLNSAKFVFKTMPRDHPYATGLLAAMVTATGAGNRNLKSYLEGTIPLTLPILGKINLNPVHYSPFDIAGEPLDKAGSMIAPQITEPVFTSKGVDPLTGEKFEGEKKGEAGEGTAAARVGVSALESYIPGLRLASQLDREGGVPTKTSIFPWESTRKLGLGKAALKSFSPFMFNYVRPKKATGTGGSATQGTGGGYGSSGSYGSEAGYK